MTSQLNVDTIVDKAGTGGATLTTPTLTGISNTSTYTEGSVTQSLRESAVKHWTIVDQTGTTESLGSFNQSSLTDAAVGRTDLTFTNNFSSVNKCTTISNSYGMDGCWYQVGNTTNYRIVNYVGGAYTDFDHSSGRITGDLA